MECFSLWKFCFLSHKGYVSFPSAIFLNISNIIALWIALSLQASARRKPGIFQLRATHPIWSTPHTVWQKESDVAGLSQAKWVSMLICLLFHLFLGFLRGHIILLYLRIHTLHCDCFISLLAQRKIQWKAGKKTWALHTVSGTQFWLLFPFDAFGFIKGFYRMGIKEDLHAWTQVKWQSENICVPAFSPAFYSW